jgi:hypothetical protein
LFEINSLRQFDMSLYILFGQAFIWCCGILNTDGVSTLQAQQRQSRYPGSRPRALPACKAVLALG